MKKLILVSAILLSSFSACAGVIICDDGKCNKPMPRPPFEIVDVPAPATGAIALAVLFVAGRIKRGARNE